MDSGFANSYGSICIARAFDGKFLKEVHFDQFITLPFQSPDLPLIWSSLLKLRKYQEERPYSLWVPADVLDWISSLDFQLALHACETVVQSEERITGIDLLCTPTSVLEKELDASSAQWAVVSHRIEILRTLALPYALWSSGELVDWLATIDPNIPGIVTTTMKYY